MNKKGFAILAVVLIVVVVLVAGGILYYEFHNTASQTANTVNSGQGQVSALSTSTAPAESLSLCNGLLNYHKDQCYAGVATANKDITTCDKITADSLRADCYAQVAGVTGDIGDCYKYPEGQCFNNVAVYKNDLAVCDSMRHINFSYLVASQSRDGCYEAVAAARKDPSLCGQVATSSRDQCYITIAYTAKDPSFCSSVIASSSQTFCVARATPPNPDASACNAKTGTDKDTCLIEAAIASSSTAPCAKVSNSGYMQICYNEVSRSLTNSAACDSIADQAEKDSCYLDVAQNTNNVDLCSKIVSSTVQKSCQNFVPAPTAASCTSLPPLTSNSNISIGASSASCYINLSQYYRDDAYCASVPDIDGARSYCYDQDAAFTLDPATCGKITGTDAQSTGDRDQCYLTIGSDLGDLNSCLKITDERLNGFKDQCLQATEAITRSTSTCTALTGRYQDECYANIAFELGDDSLCKNISSPTIMDTCNRFTAMANVDVSLCALVKDPTSHAACVSEVNAEH